MNEIEKKKASFKKILTDSKMSTSSYFRCSSEILEFLFKFQDFFPNPTFDQNILKIGLGHPCDTFHNMKCITLQQSIGLFLSDIEEIEDVLNKWYNILLQCQFDALVSFILDIGIDAFEKSEFPSLIEDGFIDSVPKFMMNVKMTEEKVKRRKREINIYLGESYSRPFRGGISSEFNKSMNRDGIIKLCKKTNQK